MKLPYCSLLLTMKLRNHSNHFKIFKFIFSVSIAYSVFLAVIDILYFTSQKITIQIVYQIKVVGVSNESLITGVRNLD